MSSNGSVEILKLNSSQNDKMNIDEEMDGKIDEMKLKTTGRRASRDSVASKQTHTFEEEFPTIIL